MEKVISVLKAIDKVVKSMSVKIPKSEFITTKQQQQRVD